MGQLTEAILFASFRFEKKIFDIRAQVVRSNYPANKGDLIYTKESDLQNTRLGLIKTSSTSQITANDHLVNNLPALFIKPQNTNDERYCGSPADP